MIHIIEGNNNMKNRVNFDILLNLIICIMICFCVNYSVNAQSMKLVIGQYECTSNTPCNNGYCDIETHKCATCNCPEPDGESCVTVSDCEAGWSVVNNVCKECTSDDECSGDKPQCVSNQCVACPTNRPVWNGEYCDCPDGEINVDGTCMKCISSKDCPTDKPVCNATSHKCESCPTEKPNWNGEYCDCQEGYYSIKGECLQLRECFSNKNCAMPKPVCNLDEGLCEACPTTSPIWNDEKCVQCLNNTDCSGYELTPSCDLTDNRCKSCENIDSNKPYFFNNKCVQCLSNSDCSGNTPWCDTSVNTCKPCKNDASCSNNLKCAPTGACVKCTNNGHCSGSTPWCDTSAYVCKPCQSPNPYWSTANKTCAPCPDGTTQSNGKCIIDFGNLNVDACPWGPAPGWKSIIQKFGPYNYDFKVYVDGYADDNLRFYVNSTNMPSGSQYNSWWDWVDGTQVASIGYNKHWQNYHLGTLKKGDHGGILLTSNSGCIYWKNPGHIWLELVE